MEGVFTCQNMTDIVKYRCGDSLVLVRGGNYMLEITALFSTNYCERTDLKIEEGAIQEFTRNAYTDGGYRATVSFECMPRCFNPDTLQFIMELKEMVECIIVWGTICAELIKFARKTHGYVKHIMIKGKRRGIQISDDMTAEELEKEIKSILEEDAEK